MERVDSALDHSTSGSHIAVNVRARAFNCLNTRSWYTCTLRYFNMFRHMYVPRDTSVLCEIIIVCLESVGNCQTLRKRQTFATCEKYHILSFFFSLRQMTLVSYRFLPCFEVPRPCVLYIVFMGINRQLSISCDSQSRDCISVFIGKSKVE